MVQSILLEKDLKSMELNKWFRLSKICFQAADQNELYLRIDKINENGKSYMFSIK